MQKLKEKFQAWYANLQVKLQANKKNQVIYSIAIVVATMLLIFLLLFVMTRPKETKEDAAAKITPTEKREPTITRKPTKKVSPSVTPRLSPTVKLTVTVTPSPTVASATATPAPTSAPTATPDTEAPTLQQMTGPENGSTVDFSNFCFPMMYKDNRNSSSEIFVRYKFDSDTYSDWKKDYAPCYNNVSNGSHTFNVQAKDTSGNESSVTTRTFTVNVAVSTPTPSHTPVPSD